MDQYLVTFDYGDRVRSTRSFPTKELAEQWACDDARLVEFRCFRLLDIFKIDNLRQAQPLLEDRPRTGGRVYPGYWAVKYAKYLFPYSRLGAGRFETTCQMTFPSYEEAKEWADANHDDIPGFRLLLVYRQGDIIDYGHRGPHPQSAEARNRSDRDTDRDILKQ